MEQTVTAIVLAAGAGTRMKSDQAKVLHSLGGRTMIGHALHAVAGVNPDVTVAVVGHGREAVEPHIGQLDSSIRLAVQAHRDGTGGAVRAALHELDATPHGTVLITYGDVPLLETQTLRDLLGAHHKHRAGDNKHSQAITIVTSELGDPSGYGRIVRDGSGAVQAIREQKDASAGELDITEVNSGILAVEAGFLASALGKLSTDNAQGELYLTDIIGIAVADGRTVGTHLLDDVWQAEGVNDRIQLARLGAELNRRTTRGWMAAGVTITDPATTWIDCDVQIGYDTIIEPGTQLRGTTSIGMNAVIGPETTLENVAVGDYANVIRTHGSDSVIGEAASTGPFSYLRPGTHIGPEAKIGTFVETKNSSFGPGAKVPHLSYIGDTDVAEGTNIGAGTIVANYDGVTKARTHVGRYARTGSNNVFVAPVDIGDGAYTGAGTTVRDDVPPGALAVRDGRQRNIEGWVQEKRTGTTSAEAADEA